MPGPERRAQILRVARRVFGEGGFHGASMDDIAREAGITKPILYDHFESKADLYLALVESDAAVLKERVQSALVAPITNRERIRESFRAYFDFVDEHAEGLRLIVRESQAPTLSSTVDQVRENILGAVASVIQASSQGRVGAADADTVAVGLVAMVEAGAQRSPSGSPEIRARQLDMLTLLAWRGVLGVVG